MSLKICFGALARFLVKQGVVDDCPLEPSALRPFRFSECPARQTEMLDETFRFGECPARQTEKAG